MKPALVDLPSARTASYIGERRIAVTQSTPSIESNFAEFVALSESLGRADRIRLKRRRQHHCGSVGMQLNLPVLFNCPHEGFLNFREEYRDGLCRLQHALTEVLEAGQSAGQESELRSISVELDYQIAKLNELYSAAVRKQWLSGLGVALGLSITSLSLVVPEDIRALLLAIGSPATFASGLRWLGERSQLDCLCRESDFYLAWKFQSAANQSSS